MRPLNLISPKNNSPRQEHCVCLCVRIPDNRQAGAVLSGIEALVPNAKGRPATFTRAAGTRHEQGDAAALMNLNKLLLRPAAMTDPDSSFHQLEIRAWRKSVRISTSRFVITEEMRRPLASDDFRGSPKTPLMVRVFIEV